MQKRIRTNLEGGCASCGKENINKSNQDHIYYNVVIENHSSSPIPAEFSETRVSSIIDNPSEYYLSVIRFSIPGLKMPILNFPLSANQQLWVTITDRNTGNNFSRQVLFQSRSNIVTDFEVNTYQHMLNMVNTALAAAYADAGGGTAPPFFYYDPATQLFTLRALKNEFYPATAMGFEIWVNYNLFNFFSDLDGFSRGYNNADNKDFNYWVQPTDPAKEITIGADTFLDMTCELNTQYLWQDMARLVIQSDSLKVQNEFIKGSEGSNVQQPIIADFEPFVTGSQKTNDVYQYVPLGPYKLIDILSTTALNKLDCRIFWQDRFFRQFPVLIPPHRYVTLKFLFIRKKNCC